MSSLQSIHTDCNDVTISTEWLDKDSEERTRLLIVKTEGHEFTFFMDEKSNILLNVGRD